MIVKIYTPIFIKLLLFLFFVFIFCAFPKSIFAQTVPGYGWGKVTFAQGTGNSFTYKVHDASGAPLVPDNLTITVSSPGSPPIVNFTCSGTCLSSYTFAIPTQVAPGGLLRVDHTSYVDKLGFNPAESPGAFKLDPAVVGSPTYSCLTPTTCTQTTLDVYLTTTGTPPQISNFSPTPFKYYGFIPPLSETINPPPGATNAKVTIFNWSYDTVANSFKSKTFDMGGGPYPKSVPLTLEDTVLNPYPDTPLVQMDNVVEDQNGNRSSTGTFYFGLDRQPPAVSCNVYPTGKSLKTDRIELRTYSYNTISGVGADEFEVSNDYGATWSNAGIVYVNSNGVFSYYYFIGTVGQTYTFHYRARNNALQSDGSPGLWSPIYNCGGVTIVAVLPPTPPGPLGVPVTNGGFTTSAAVNPTSIHIGAPFQIDVRVTSANAGNFLVDVETMDNNGRTWWQDFSDNQSFAAGETKSYSYPHSSMWATSGLYTIQVYITPVGWGYPLHQNNNAATLFMTEYDINSFVYNDLNKNGVQDPCIAPNPCESGFSYVKRTLSGDELAVATPPRGDHAFYNLIGTNYTVTLTLPVGYIYTPTPTNTPVHIFDLSSPPTSVSFKFGIFKKGVSDPGVEPSCTPIVVNPDTVFATRASGVQYTSSVSATCQFIKGVSWTPLPAIGTIANTTIDPTFTNLTATYTAPISIPSAQDATISLSVLGLDDIWVAMPSVLIHVKPYVPPYISTQGGDVHSNKDINLPP